MPKLQDDIEFIGIKYNKLTVISDKGIKNGSRMVLAICECGSEKTYQLKCLKSGNTKSCGCIKKNNLLSSIGKKYNKLTILCIVKSKSGRGKVKVICECGTIKECDFHNIQSGSTTNCGCERSGRTTHPLFIVWRNMLSRCYNLDDMNYYNYGGKGVKVSIRWKDDYEAFYEWAINRWRPGLQLDKDIKSSMSQGVLYCPELCCFVSRKENCRKRRNNVAVFHKGELKCLTEWCEIYNLNYWAIRSRIKRGWNPEIALTKPLRKLCQ